SGRGPRGTGAIAFCQVSVEVVRLVARPVREQWREYLHGKIEGQLPRNHRIAHEPANRFVLLRNAENDAIEEIDEVVFRSFPHLPNAEAWRKGELRKEAETEWIAFTASSDRVYKRTRMHATLLD